MTFDGSSGENCMARRDRSNTPLQALTLLNDEMFLELAESRVKKYTSKKGMRYTNFLDDSSPVRPAMRKKILSRNT